MARTGVGSIYTRKAVEIFRKSMKICSFVSITVSYQKKKKADLKDICFASIKYCLGSPKESGKKELL